jgi:hypothetical protein
VAEVKTSGKLEIETAGKKVHKNADEPNPAVHVAREEGNDVVKRASELTKEGSAGPEAAASKDPSKKAKVEDEKEAMTVETITIPTKEEKQKEEKQKEEKQKEEKPEEKKPEEKKPEEAPSKEVTMEEAPAKPEEGAQLAGSKRDRVETPPAEEGAEKPVEEKKVEEEAKVEKETGKETKKPKVEADASVKDEGREKKDEAKFEGEKIEAPVQDPLQQPQVKTPKKKAAKPKKTREESPVTFSDTPATRTRSKAS